MSDTVWAILGIEPTQNKREIRKAYAEQSKLHHPEEEPEVFARLNQAYQEALRYASSGVNDQYQAAIIDIDSPASGGENILLSRLQREEERKAEESLAGEALQELIAIFEDENRRNKANVWKEFFLSECFLREQQEETFGRGLLWYLQKQTIEEMDKLPVYFLGELMIAYGVFTENAGKISGDCYPREAAAYLQSIQNGSMQLMKLGMVVNKSQNRARAYSNADYLRMCSLNRQGYLTEKERQTWEPILAHGGWRSLYSVLNGKTAQERSERILSLYAYWIRTENVPKCVCQYIYKEYELKDPKMYSVNARPLCMELRQAILERYPEIGENGEEHEKEQMLKRWYAELMNIVSDHWLENGKVSFEESETIKIRVAALFEQMNWDTIKWEEALFHKIYSYLTEKETIPESLALRLIEFYGKEVLKGTLSVNSDQVIILVEWLLRSMSIQREMAEKDYRYVYSYEKTDIADIGDDNKEFWAYFLMRGFGTRYADIVGSVLRKGDYVRENRLYLPAYIKTMCQASVEWQKLFTGFDEKENTIHKPKSLSFTIPDGRELRAEFHLHYVVYFLDGCPVIEPALTFQELLRAARIIKKTEEFFCLLAVTAIEEEEREAAGLEIEKWLNRLPLCPAIVPVAAKLLAVDNDLGEVVEESSDKGAIQAVYYEEQERICCRAVVYRREVKLYHQTDFGWKEVELSAEEWQWTDEMTLEAEKQFALKKLQSLMMPKPVKIDSFSLEGMNNRQKASCIIEALKQQEKYRVREERKTPVVPELWWEEKEAWMKIMRIEPEGEYDEVSMDGVLEEEKQKYEKIGDVIKDFYGKDGGWMTESYCVLHYGSQDKNCFQRIFYSAMDPYGFAIEEQSKEFAGIFHMRTAELDSKIKETHRILGRFGWGESYSKKRTFAPLAFAVGESGTFYGFDLRMKLHKEKGLSGLMEKMFDFSYVTSIDIYAGALRISPFDNRLEY